MCRRIDVALILIPVTAYLIEVSERKQSVPRGGVYGPTASNRKEDFFDEYHIT
jgi:hypothetical protein